MAEEACFLFFIPGWPPPTEISYLPGDTNLSPSSLTMAKDDGGSVKVTAFVSPAFK